uniref:Peptidase A1 domain-containing protein n=1 Tax=Kalanchoe fedtschenkoi TaxID=63787 RepID=A0A7N0UVF2_KALFE
MKRLKSHYSEQQSQNKLIEEPAENARYAKTLASALLQLCGCHCSLVTPRVAILSKMKEQIAKDTQRTLQNKSYETIHRLSSLLIDFLHLKTFQSTLRAIILIFLFSSYFTKLQIGSPPKTLNVVIDTGSDLTWVKCANYVMQTSRNFYNVFESSTAVSCAQESSCTFDMHYKDGSRSSGYYVSDIIHFSTFLPNSSRSQFSSRVVFGCSTMNTIDSDVDGIIGLGRAKESLQSQLFAQHISSTAISHCLTSEGGGGYLIMGEVVEQGITYIPLIPSESKYIVSMESISLNRKQIASTYFPGTSAPPAEPKPIKIA